MIVKTEKQRKALQAAAESGKQEGVQGVWGFKYTIFTGPLKPCSISRCLVGVCVCASSSATHASQVEVFL